MAVRSKPLFLGNSGAANAQVVVYTAPSGETALAKCFIFRWRNAANGTFDVLLRNPALAVSVVQRWAMVLDQSVTWQPFIPLPEGWSILLRSSIASSTEIYIGGAELEGLAD